MISLGAVGNATKIRSVDYNDRESMNTVFGEKQVGVRRADIVAQFQYGFPAGSADADVANGGTVSTVESMLTVTTGTNIAGAASIANKKALRYLPGHEAFMFFTVVFTAGEADSFQRAGLFDNKNGFFLGFEGEDFCVTRRRGGVDTKVIIDIASVFPDGTFDPTNGNVYKISFGYLGFACINFEAMMPDGSWVLIHKIEYPNTATETHILNTNLQPRAEVANTGNSTDIVVKSGSFSAGVVNGGGHDPAARRFTIDILEQAVTAGDYMLLTIRSKDAFNSLTNYIEAVLSLLSLSTDLSKSSLWEFRSNMTITNTPTWTDVETNDSVLEFSTDAVVTADTGALDLAITMGRLDKFFEEIQNQDINIFPGDTLTILVKTPAGANGTVTLALRETELF